METIVNWNRLENTTSDIGSNFSQSGGSFSAGKWASGYNAGENQNARLTQTSQTIGSAGTIDYIWKPSFGYTDSTLAYAYHFTTTSSTWRMINMHFNTGGFNLLRFYMPINGSGGMNELRLDLAVGAIGTKYGWSANDEIHIRKVWDNSGIDSGSKTQQNFWNGVLIPTSDYVSGFNTDTGSIISSDQTVSFFVGANESPFTNSSNGEIDNWKRYSSAITDLSNDFNIEGFGGAKSRRG